MYQFTITLYPITFEHIRLNNLNRFHWIDKINEREVKIVKRPTITRSSEAARR